MLSVFVIRVAEVDQEETFWTKGAYVYVGTGKFATSVPSPCHASWWPDFAMAKQVRRDRLSKFENATFEIVEFKETPR